VLTLLILLPLLVFLGLPTWPYSQRWTYAPSAALGVVTLAFVLLIVAGRL
jgi:hypothetical protein